MLGEGDWSVMVADQGGVAFLGELTQIARMTVKRERDHIGECNIIITGPDSTCCALLSDLRTVRHEIVLFRDGVRVWEGPVTRIEYGVERVEIAAQDVGWYLSRRALEFGFDYSNTSYPALTALYDTLLLHYPVVGDRFNIGRYLTRITSADDPNTAAKYLPYTRTVGNLLERYASYGGVDYVTMGRRIVLFGTHTRAHVLPMMNEEHLGDSIKVTEYGSETMTRLYVTNNEETYTEAVAPEPWMSYYGKIDQVQNNVDEGDGVPDQSDLDAMQKTAEKELANGYPTPTRVWLPANSRLDPCYPVDFKDIHPGAWVPIQSGNTCRHLSQWQKMQTVSVTWEPGSEAVNVSLTNAPLDMFDPVSIITPTP